MTTNGTGSAAPALDRPRHELADVFRLYGDAYRHTHALPTGRRRVMHAIEACRTAQLGGHLERCTDCAFERPAYNSCRHRHCPKCQSLTKARWLEARQADLLPVDYFHTVFTVPHDLNTRMLANTACLYQILFEAVADTLPATHPWRRSYQELPDRGPWKPGRSAGCGNVEISRLARDFHIPTSPLSST